MMLKIKKVPTVVSNYQKDEADEGRQVGGCGRNCLNKCCIPGAKLPLYSFKKHNQSTGDEKKEAPVSFNFLTH